MVILVKKLKVNGKDTENLILEYYGEWRYYRKVKEEEEKFEKIDYIEFNAYITEDPLKVIIYGTKHDGTKVYGITTPIGVYMEYIENDKK